MGTPEFAVPALDQLVESGFSVVGVVTATDKIGGRGRTTVITSAVKDRALTLNIPVLQPEKLRDPAFLEALKEWNADLFVVVAFRMLPEIVWSMPPLGTVNLHGSLLPAYRGAAPIHWAVLNGERETGVTVFFLQHAIDTGDLLYQEHMAIGTEETSGDVYDRMMQIGSRALVRAMNMIRSGNVQLQPQTAEKVSHAPKIFPETGQLDFHWPVHKLVNWVRGMNPYPSAWFLLDNKIVKIHTAHADVDLPNEPPGMMVLDHKTLRIAASDGWLIPTELQMEGRKRVPVLDFLNGMNWPQGTVGQITRTSIEKNT
ncbi:MAG: methionyl-tRNA formyltransferase [Saprospiraceae bacterium]|nr:methionyl-tRNA formyltransferase [Saprospiraceae bacterium]